MDISGALTKTKKKEDLQQLLEEAKESRPCAGERAVMTQEEILRVTDDARQHGPTRAAAKWNKKNPSRCISQSAASRYLIHYKENGSYYSPHTRGRHELLTKTEKAATLSAFDLLRSQAIGVDCPLFAAFVRGIVETERPGATCLRGGVLKVSNSFAHQFLKSNGFKVRKGTTDRTVDASTVRRDGDLFFKQLASCGVTNPKFIFNVDEFFVTLDSANKKWTWVRSSHYGAVALREHRVGFTASVFSSASGEIHCLQLLWQGKTSAVHADVEHRCVYQDHREDSHFQNSATWARFCTHMLKLINGVRNNNMDEKVLFVFDQATQHNTTEELFANNNIVSVPIPKAQTHIFQPADQYIICGLRKKAKCAFDDWVANLFADNSISDAVKQLISTSTPKLRHLKATFLCAAVDSLSSACIVKSWDVTGIRRAACGIEPPQDTLVLFDAYLQGTANVPFEVDAATEAAPGVDSPTAQLEEVPQAAVKRGRHKFTEEEIVAAAEAKEKKRRTERAVTASNKKDLGNKVAAKGSGNIRNMFEKKKKNNE